MELFLIAVDKFINTPKAFSVVILVGILVITQKRNELRR